MSVDWYRPVWRFVNGEGKEYDVAGYKTAVPEFADAERRERDPKGEAVDSWVERLPAGSWERFEVPTSRADGGTSS